MVEGGVAEFLKAQTVDQQFSLPYAHYPNLVERHVQTVVNRVTTTLHDQLLLGFTFGTTAYFTSSRFLIPLPIQRQMEGHLYMWSLA